MPVVLLFEKHDWFCWVLTCPICGLCFFNIVARELLIGARLLRMNNLVLGTVLLHVNANFGDFSCDLLQKLKNGALCTDLENGEP